ncbi:DUF4127 family protein [Bacillus pinisoli]|uniref:DUF4127 family protein n=1 Tax=Bacillus pinisoli TaxID=2901866 RepID=UPI001FF231BC|nr:DUF4127 family protein [Bacillus pinisoli]
MFKFKLLIFITISVFILVLFFFAQSKENIPTLAIVPLDDRPINVYDAQKIAEIGGINTIFPKREDLGNFQNPGNTENLRNWLINHGEDVDGFIISIDMIGFGGLVASRTLQTSKEKALKNIEIIKELKIKYPDKPIYVFNAVQRLAVTVSEKESLDIYWSIRNWAILYDEVYNLNMKEKENALKNLEKTIPKEILTKYLDARERNHLINITMIEWLSEGYIDYLILSQDDASKTGLHRFETELLKEKSKALNLSENQLVFFSGTDEDSLILISRYINSYYNIKPKHYLHYVDKEGPTSTGYFESMTTQENIEKHITAINGVITDSEADADIHLFINTIVKGEKSAKFMAATKKINALLKEKKPVSIIDADVKTRDDRFMTYLKENVDISQLYGFSSWNTIGNTIGIAISHSSTRFSMLNNNLNMNETILKSATKSHIEFLLSRLAKDEGYKNDLHDEIKQYVTNINGDYLDLDDHYEQTYNFSKDKVINRTHFWFNSLKNEKFVYQTNESKYIIAKELEEVYFDFPWKRLFDISLEPKIAVE